jgi:mono/diheme cytochrome c family protein
MRSHTLIKTLLCAALPLLSAVTLAAPSASVVLDGKALFNEKCAMCHNAFGMGTGLLARRVDPAVAELEKRSDLTAAYVERAARIGILNMMPITRADASDAQLAAIAGYLSKGKP